MFSSLDETLKEKYLIHPKAIEHYYKFWMKPYSMTIQMKEQYFHAVMSVNIFQNETLFFLTMNSGMSSFLLHH